MGARGQKDSISPSIRTHDNPDDSAQSRPPSPDSSVFKIYGGYWFFCPARLSKSFDRDLALVLHKKVRPDWDIHHPLN